MTQIKIKIHPSAFKKIASGKGMLFISHNCQHRRTKKNYNFGRKSSPFIYCKDCGKVVTPYMIMKKNSRFGGFRELKEARTNGEK